MTLHWCKATNFHISGTLWGSKHIYTVYCVKHEMENVSMNHLKVAVMVTGDVG